MITSQMIRDYFLQWTRHYEGRSANSNTYLAYLASPDITCSGLCNFSNNI